MTSDDINSAIARGEWKEITAKKDIPISVRPGEKGEVVSTYVEDGQLKETQNTVKDDSSFIVTNQIAGHKNEYILTKEKLHKNYLLTDDPSVWMPKGETKKVYVINKNISFSPSWGGEMKILKGGVIIPEPDGTGFYGIGPKEFQATYSIL